MLYFNTNVGATLFSVCKMANSRFPDAVLYEVDCISGSAQKKMLGAGKKEAARQSNDCDAYG